MFLRALAGRIRMPHRAGLRVRALMELITVAAAMVSPNWRYITPVMPPRNEVGTNTASSTRVVAMIGPETSSIARMDACLGVTPGSSRLRATFSTTTIASSTTMPMASTSPKSVRVLMVNPRAAMTAKVPISETGMVSAGISVARKSCRKNSTVRITSTAAMNRVSTISAREARTALAAS